MQAAFESALAELVFGAAIDPNDRAAIDAWLTRHGVPEEDARAVIEQGLSGFLVYRALVRGTLHEALEVSIPRTIARLGPLYAEGFDRFLEQRGPRTHYLRDVTAEFLDFSVPRWAADARVPPYIADLARHEALHIQVAAAPPAAANAEPAPLELESGLVFTEASRLVHYAYAVHELPEDTDDRSLPAKRETHLFVYRSNDHMVRYLALSPLAAGIVRRLMAGASLRESLVDSAAEQAVPLDDAVLSGAARVLADLSERGAVIGPGRAHEPRSPSA